MSQGVPKDIVRAWKIASTFRAHLIDGQWTRETCILALCEIAGLLEDYAFVWLGPSSFPLSPLVVRPASSFEHQVRQDQLGPPRAQHGQ